MAGRTGGRWALGHPILYPHGDLKRQDPAKKAPFRLLIIGFFAIARPEIDRYRSRSMAAWLYVPDRPNRLKWLARSFASCG